MSLQRKITLKGASCDIECTDGSFQPPCLGLFSHDDHEETRNCLELVRCALYSFRTEPSLIPATSEGKCLRLRSPPAWLQTDQFTRHVGILQSRRHCRLIVLSSIRHFLLTFIAYAILNSNRITRAAMLLPPQLMRRCR